MKLSIHLFLSAIFSVALVAQTPEELAEQALSKLKSLDLIGFVENTHPDELENYKSLLVEAAELSEELQYGGLFRIIPWAESSENLKAMEPLVIYRKLYEHMFGLLQGEESEQMQYLQELLANSSFKILGSTEEEDGIVYVSYEFTKTMNGMSQTEIETQGFRKHQGKWMLMMDPSTINSVKEIISQLKETIQNKSSLTTPEAAPPTS